MTNYRQRAHVILDKFKSENTVKFLYNFMRKLYIRWEGGECDE